MTYTVVLREEPEGGYTVLVPTFPEIVSYGEDLKQALRMAADAIRCAIVGRETLGEDVPEEAPVVAIPEEERTGDLLVARVAPAPLNEALTHA